MGVSKALTLESIELHRLDIIKCLGEYLITDNSWTVPSVEDMGLFIIIFI